MELPLMDNNILYLHHPHIQARLRRELLPDVTGGFGRVIVGVLQRLQLFSGDGGSGPFCGGIGF